MYRERGHRRLDAQTYEAKCRACLWGCRMPVDMIVDPWKPLGEVGQRARARYVLCVKNRGYAASLERKKVYRRLDDARASRHGLIRVVDESGQDYLYPGSYFVSIAVPETARRALAHTR